MIIITHGFILYRYSAPPYSKANRLRQRTKKTTIRNVPRTDKVSTIRPLNAKAAAAELRLLRPAVFERGPTAVSSAAMSGGTVYLGVFTDSGQQPKIEDAVKSSLGLSRSLVQKETAQPTDEEKEQKNTQRAAKTGQGIKAAVSDHHAVPSTI